MKAHTIKLALSLTVLMVANSVQAFEQDMPKSARFYPEQSQEQVSQQQALTGKIGVVGQVEENTFKDAPGASVTSDSSESFASAEAQKAKATFGSAANAVQTQESPVRWFFVLPMLLGLFILGALGFKAYTDKAVPLPKSLQN